MKGQAIDKDPDSTVAEKGHINPKAPEFVSVISLEEPKAERKDGPIANSSSNSSRLQSPDDKRSVKYLTCYYWHTTGDCTKGDNCAYSHEWTGRLAEKPKPIGPGGRVIAGNSAKYVETIEKAARESQNNWRVSPYHMFYYNPGQPVNSAVMGNAFQNQPMSSTNPYTSAYTYPHYIGEMSNYRSASNPQLPTLNAGHPVQSFQPVDRRMTVGANRPGPSVAASNGSFSHLPTASIITVPAKTSPPTTSPTTAVPIKKGREQTPRTCRDTADISSPLGNVITSARELNHGLGNVLLGLSDVSALMTNFQASGAVSSDDVSMLQNKIRTSFAIANQHRNVARATAKTGGCYSEIFGDADHGKLS